MDSASRTDGIGVGVLCLTCLLVQLPGGWRQVLAVGHAHGKFGLGSFQWYYNGSAIAGATNAFLSLTNLQGFNSGVYQVLVSNPLKAVAGPAINVVIPTLHFDPASIVWQPQNRTITMNLIDATGTNPVVIYASTNLLVWQAVFTNPPSANPINFTDTRPTGAGRRFYRARQ